MSIIPEKFIEQLSVSSTTLSSKDICALTLDFKSWLKEAFADEEAITLVAARSTFVDSILCKLWSQHHLDTAQVSLLAVGGYGRGELHPYSDVDILILTQEKTTREVEENIGAFVTQLWDVKLDIGHSVRSTNECLKQAKADVTIATNLLEMRLICGNDTLPKQLQPLLNDDKYWTSKKFFIAKRDEQKNRHEQHHGAAYTLEPNLKANPGGLRDIQTIAWVAKRHFKADSLEELAEHDYLTRNEFHELLECQDYLWRMRFALHIIAGRNENRLLFDYQSDVAKLLGFGDEGKFAVECMMKRLFRIIARVSELNIMLLHRFEQDILNEGVKDKVVKINDDFIMVNTLIKATNPQVFMRSVKFMEMFLIIAQHPAITGLHPDTLRRMRNARRRLVSGLNDYAGSRKIFMQLMKHPRGLDLPFTLMHKHGIIGAYLPEWRSIMGQMQFDLFHAYSVDEHSFRLIKNLHRFSLPEYNHEFPLCSKIIQRVRKPELLYIAGIFHDIAKGRGGDHAELGAIDALRFGKSHLLHDLDSNMIAWLVESHLVMSVTAQRRDISSHEVIKEFAEVVRDEAHLDYLYCLTVADMRATNESLWNSWKSNLLEELYSSTKQALRHGLEKPVNLKEQIEENKEGATTLLTKVGVAEVLITELWKELNDDYFLRYSPEQIAWHSKNILKHDRSQPLVLISPKPYRGGTEVFVFTKVRKNIFSTTINLLGNKRLSIHDAKIITSNSGYTVNTYVILDQVGKPIDDSYRALEIAQSLTTALCKDISNDFSLPPIAERFKQFKVRTRINFINNNKYTTLLEIIALDQPGLLAYFAQVFQNCHVNIHSAKITTFGEKVEDVFTITNADNMPLTEHEQQQLKSLLTEEISA